MCSAPGTSGFVQSSDIVSCSGTMYSAGEGEGAFGQENESSARSVDFSDLSSVRGSWVIRRPHASNAAILLDSLMLATKAMARLQYKVDPNHITTPCLVTAQTEDRT